MKNIDAPFTVHGTPNRVAEAIFVTIMGCKGKAAARDATYIEWLRRRDRVICTSGKYRASFCAIVYDLCASVKMLGLPKLTDALP